ncbi:hypothetical protein RIF29_25456 [Crotalaria pallida]|uniref:Uncharacterized protein n=1 Tax=Crotalaria pallida TaxID=3830 RepID=A0AAN9I487_CROPI
MVAVAVAVASDGRYHGHWCIGGDKSLMRLWLIFTNANDVDAVRVLHRFGVEDFFDTIINFEHDFSIARTYKKLIKAVDNQSRRHTFKRLSYEIKLEEKHRETFTLLHPKKALVEVVSPQEGTSVVR